MAEFEDPIHRDEVSVDEIILKLNDDQLHVFNKVKSAIENQTSAVLGEHSEIL